jgi:hypothetical protein
MIAHARRLPATGGAPGLFDPDRIAHFEARGWRAYYDRDWLRLCRLMVSTCQEQFRIPFPSSVVAAYYLAKGARAWAPINHDIGVVERYYGNFYRIARRHSGLAFDLHRVVQLEMRYNDIHRRLVGHDDKSEFVDALTELHAAIFGLSKEQARESAEWRVAANTTVDGISNHWSTDVEGDWARLEEQLRHCYRSLIREVAAGLSGAPWTPSAQAGPIT